MLLPIGLQDFQTLISQKTVGGITWCEHPFSVGGGGGGGGGEPPTKFSER